MRPGCQRGPGHPHMVTLATGATIAAVLAELRDREARGYVAETGPGAEPGPLAEAIEAWHLAALRFTYCQARPGKLDEAEQALRAAGADPGTGLSTLPANAVRFSDVLADGQCIGASSGSITGPVWLCLSRDHGRDFRAFELVRVRRPGYRPARHESPAGRRAG